MNIFLHEFRQKTNSVLIWSGSLAVMILVFLSIFPSFADNTEALNKTLESFPEEFLMAFGMNGIDFSSLVGFYGIGILFALLAIGIQAANYGLSLVSVEERDLTADFLLTKPISRLKILTNKLLAALAALLITNLVVWAATYILVLAFKGDREVDYYLLNLMLLSVSFVQLFFLSVGMGISQVVRKIRSVVPYSMGLVFGLYVISAFSGMLGDDLFAVISPFKQFDPNGIIQRGGYDANLILINLVFVASGFALTYFLYPRRDIHSI